MCAMPQPHDDYKPTPPRQAVIAAQNNAALDHLLTRLSGVLGHYPPSPVVLDRFICSDPKLKERILRAVHQFATPDREHPLDTIADCMEVMSDSVVTEIAMVMILDQINAEVFKGSGFLSREMTKHAVATAAVLKWLAQRQGTDADIAFIHGMLYRIGIPVLCNWNPLNYAQAIAKIPGTSVQLVDAERSIMTIDHFMAGTEMAIVYEFPHWFQEELDPTRLPTPTRRNVAFASTVAHKLGYDMGLANRGPDLTPKMLQAAKMEQDELPELRHYVMRAVRDFNSYHVDPNSIEPR
jgi:HD-like signal output (HDOD) protein